MKEDLNIKIGSKDEKAWTQIRDRAKEELEQQKRAIIISEAVIEIADKKAKEEAKKFKEIK